MSERLGVRCYTDGMLPQRVLSFFEHTAPVEPGDVLLCAVSGGPDSTALLHILIELGDTLGTSVEAAHMNHRLGRARLGA